MNKKIIAIVIAVIIIIIGVVYFINQPKAQQNTTPPTSTGSQNQPASPQTVNVIIENFSFNPSVLNIKKGDTVVWVNNDSVPHQIAGDSFQGNPMSKGQSFSFTFNSAGSFNYHCKIHPSMTGKIVVE